MGNKTKLLAKLRNCMNSLPQTILVANSNKTQLQ